jgi:hypothetical protein
MACPYASALLERLALQKLHDDEGLACVLINVVDDADVGMVKRGSRAGLALEAFHGLVIFGELFWEELERYKPAERRVFGLVDHTHAPAAELFQDAIVRNGLTDHCEGSAFGGHLRPRLQLSQRKGSANYDGV